MPPHLRPRRSRSVPPGAAARAACLAVLVLLAAAAPLAGQEASERRASASLEGSLAVTPIHGSATWMAGLTGLISLGHRVSLGGGGDVALQSRRVAGSVPGSDLDLRVAFGGFVAQVLVLEGDRHEGWARLLVGAGNAKLDLAAVGVQIASDNFGVLHPEVGGSVRVHRRLRAGVAAGYRVTYGVEDLPGVGAPALRGASARVLLSIHHP